MLKEQIIDVTRSFLVTDPEAFYENQMVSQREDSPEKMLPIVAYEGYNFLPTLYGYRSYFDATSKLDIGSLASRCDRIVLYQFANYQNILVALCEDGIWTNSGGTAAEAWSQRVTLSVPSVGSYLEWTFCVIENTLYMYRQGGGSVYTVKPTSYALGNPVENFAPSFLNMSGQMGIFRANGRLGFWDSANSVSWSSLFSFSDFTPSVETLAGFATFNDILGRIVTIKSHGSGFIIYSTKNIVGVSYEAAGSVLFSARTIAEVAGIWTSKEVCSGAVDTEQFAYTNTGIKHISAGFKIEDIFTGVYDFLKESREPVYMDFLNGRYLFLRVINPDYISGKVSFTIQDIASATARLLTNGGEALDAEDIPDDIEGKPLSEAVIDAILGGLTEGLYAEWTASGSKLVPGRVSSMDPYLLDDPFTPDDDFPYGGNTAPLYTTEELIAARDEGIFFNKVAVDNSKPPSTALGWHDAPLGTGRPDDGLARMIARQQKEWDEYNILFSNFVSAVAAIPTNTELDWYDPAYYDDPGTPDGIWIDTDWTTIGYISDPLEGTTTSAVFSGVGTYSASYEKQKIFTQRRAVQNRTPKAWVANYPAYGFFAHVNHGVVPPGSVAVYCNVDRIYYHDDILAVYDSGLSPLLMNSRGPNCTQVLVDAAFDAMIASVIAKIDVPPSFTIPGYTEFTYFETRVDTSTYPNTRPLVITSGGTNILSVIGRASIIYVFKTAYGSECNRVTIVVSSATENVSSHPDAAGATVSRSMKGYNRETQLRLQSSESGGGFSSIMYASQSVLDWALWIGDVTDEEKFPYTTNELELGPISSPESLLPNSLTVTYPGSTFLLQNATTAPIYPDFAGALVYDLPLQKWGKAKCTYRCLMDYSPINSNVEQVIDYTNFGLTAGLLAADGFLRLFSANCTDSFIRYGKLAFSRIGYTYPEELVVNFRLPFSGSIQTDVSMDGRSIHSSLQETTAFSGVGTAKVYPSYSGQWHTFAVSGNFDIRSISYTGRVSGIR